ncbi:glycosyl-phosphatidylinositol-anchored molecule-like protein [Arvicanthis niloticus]|uniref:glycosyl-phosphatidylinositol-anchored molecule-like protein n=1 Tax=Arvicanthis niloticus TaxID=61156 RepID=UPI001486FDFC|nr:glycosyl-phosphatidylinositol-anchored molecule-like protein [Arvicanthis niloticus]XP_034371895.1 glycosyl-phosphatidylinositol-anchored molecule-like protein [Arvicanthis niloticus]
MMPSFFLLILLGLPWVDTTVNNSSGMDNSTSGLDHDIEARWIPQIKCNTCETENTFLCDHHVDCPIEIRRCQTLAIRVNLRVLSVIKGCTEDCSFVYKEHKPPPMPKVIKNAPGFYFVLCCGSVRCNDGGPNNIERDLLPDKAIEEEEIARAMSLGPFNLLLCPALVLSSSILI